MADAVEIAKAYVAVIPSMEGAQSAITEGLTGVSSAAGGAAGAEMGGGILTALEGTLSGFVLPAAFLAAIATAGSYLFDLGADFDSAYDSIRTGTGATGDALEELDRSFLDIKRDVPAATQDIADSMAELNTRTGATGETLEYLTKQFLELDEIGYATDIDKATGMMNAWGIAADDMGVKLDELFIVSQSTGIGMDALTGAMSANAASMQELGFSFEETAALAGQLDRAGLDASGMLGKLSKAMTSIAKDGENPAEVFHATVEEMRGFIEAGERAQAIDMASELFGTRGAAQFVQALETGALDIDGLASSLEGASGAIDDNARSTRSWQESLDLLRNKAEVALEPFASAVFQGLSDLLMGAVDGAESLGESIGGVFDAIASNEQVLSVLEDGRALFSSMGEAGRSAFEAIAAAGEVLSPVLGPLGELVGVALLSSFTNFAKLLTGGVKTAFDVAKSGADAVRSAFEALQSFVSSMKLELPRFSLPHFNISGGEVPWGIGGQGSAPSISVDWYAKGGVTNGISLIGVGEAGPEAIMPLQGREMEPFAMAVADNLSGAGDTYNVYINGARVNDAGGVEEIVAAFLLDLKRKAAI